MIESEETKAVLEYPRLSTAFLEEIRLTIYEDLLTRLTRRNMQNGIKRQRIPGAVGEIVS